MASTSMKRLATAMSTLEHSVVIFQGAILPRSSDVISSRNSNSLALATSKDLSLVT
jgi:hypothetical protein